MSQDRPDVDLVPVIMDDSNEPVFVSLDVEDGEFAHGISVGKVSPDLVDVVPSNLCGHAVLTHQWDQGIRVSLTSDH